MHGKYLILIWLEYDTRIYMNTYVAYVIWWKICGYHDSMKEMNAPCYEKFMSYSFVHDYVLYDYQHVKGYVWLWICLLWLKYITWDIKGLLTVYSSHCNHDTDKWYRPLVERLLGYYDRLAWTAWPLVEGSGHWLTVYPGQKE